MIIKFFQWDQPKNAHCSLKDCVTGDVVVVEHEWGTFLGEVLIPDKSIEGEEPLGRVIRKATAQDRQMVLNNQEKACQFIQEIKQEVRGFELPMKVVDVQISLDGGAMVVAFLADGRVDFRAIVKSLSGRYQKTVRFQQIGSRDEARRVGGFGICGREICCRKFSGSIKSITTEMARCQLIAHRGSDRISGACGRLMCCLSFEAQQYQDMLKELPLKGQLVALKQDRRKGKIVEVFPLKQTLRVFLDDGTMIEVGVSDVIVKG